MAQFEVEVALLALLGCGDLIDDNGEFMLVVLRNGVEQVERQPLFREVEVLPVGRGEPGAVAAQLVQLLLRRYDPCRPRVDVVDTEQADVVVVVGNALQQIEVDDRPRTLPGFVKRGLLARIERLAVVAFEIVVLLADRMYV